MSHAFSGRTLKFYSCPRSKEETSNYVGFMQLLEVVTINTSTGQEILDLGAITHVSSISTSAVFVLQPQCHLAMPLKTPAIPESNADVITSLNVEVQDHTISSHYTIYTIAFCIPVASSARMVTPFLFFSTFSMNASPALYELLTKGPLAQYRNPRSSARCRHNSNVSGVMYSSTFMWRFVGRMYWPNVTTSTLTSRRSVC